MTGLTAVSLFAGIGGFDLALERSGVNVVAAVEIDDAARGVLADQFPNTTLFTDVREVTGDDLRAAGFVPERGIITAGWPCQGNSVAGHRGGLADPRSGLWKHVVRLLAETDAAWFVGENVPGLLSVNGGEDFGVVVDDLAELGMGFCWRVLDAQHFGVPQRRRRVFVVGRAGGDTRGPVEVLLEPEGRAGHPQARREAGPGTAGGSTVSTLQGGGQRGYRIDAEAAAGGRLIPTVAAALTAREGKGPDSDATTTLIAATLTAGNATGEGVRSPGRRREDDGNLVAHTLRRDPGGTGQGHNTNYVTHTLTGEGHDASEDGTGRGTPIVPMAFNPQSGGDMWLGYGEKPTALSCTQETAVHLLSAVRRLTPLECERLQGFPDGWTTTSNGKPQADAPRYRECGNAIAVPVGEWVVRGVVHVASREQADRDAGEAAA